MLTTVALLVDAGCCTPAYAAKILAIVEDWMGRRRLLQAGGATGDPQFHALRLLMVVSLKQGWAFDRLIAGHARTRKRMHAQAQAMLLGGYDGLLENFSLPQALEADGLLEPPTLPRKEHHEPQEKA